MKKKRLAIVGYGHIGRCALEAIETAPDMELAYIVRRVPAPLQEAPGVPVVGSIEEVTDVDAALLTLPSRLVPQAAPLWLSKGIATVDSFDIHNEIVSTRSILHTAALEGGVAAVTAAGWDPGSDSVVRMLLQAMAPQGITHTNFGPGMSMGHSVAARAIEGVADALSITMPAGGGRHKREVYIVPKKGAEKELIAKLLRQDDYFAQDESHIAFVDSIAELQDVGHGVSLERKGVSGQTHNQLFRYEMRINNPALTAQIMVAAARAALRMPAGCYTLPEIPPIDLLPGEREQWIKRLC